MVKWINSGLFIGKTWYKLPRISIRNDWSLKFILQNLNYFRPADWSTRCSKFSEDDDDDDDDDDNKNNAAVHMLMHRISPVEGKEYSCLMHRTWSRETICPFLNFWVSYCNLDLNDVHVKDDKNDCPKTSYLISRFGDEVSRPRQETIWSLIRLIRSDQFVAVSAQQVTWAQRHTDMDTVAVWWPHELPTNLKERSINNKATKWYKRFHDFEEKSWRNEKSIESNPFAKKGLVKDCGEVNGLSENNLLILGPRSSITTFLWSCPVKASMELDSS